MAVHEKKKDHKCEYCGKAFVRDTDLALHIDHIHIKSKKYACETCGKAFETVANLNFHIQSVHEGIKEFKCDYCQKAFAKKSNLDRHLKLVHENSKPKLEICPEIDCDFTGTKGALANHIKCHRMCDTCGKRFNGSRSKRDLESHRKTHTIKPKPEKKLPQCELCGKTYEFQSYLDKHLINCVKTNLSPPMP